MMLLRDNMGLKHLKKVYCGLDTKGGLVWFESHEDEEEMYDAEGY